MTSFSVANTSPLLHPTITTSTTSSFPTYSTNLGTIRTASSIVYIMLSMIALTGNIIVLRTVMDLKEKRPYHILIASLAMADILVGLVVLPCKVCEVLRAPWTMYTSYCRVIISLTLLSLSASILNLSLIAIDRYISITSPLKYRCNVTMQRVVKASLVVWAVAVSLSLSPVLGLGAKQGKKEKQSKFICEFKETIHSNFLIIYVLFSLLLPTIIITVLQVCAVVRARQHFARHKLIIRSQRHSARNMLQEKMVFKREVRLLCMFMLVIVLFYFCWLPLIIGILMSAISPLKVKYDVIFCLSIPVYGNSGLNPFIYLIGNSGMRRQMLESFKNWGSICTCRKNNRVANSNDIV